jgi:glutathionylspermidine synthase
MAVLSVGSALSIEDQRQLRRRMMFDHFKWDPQSGDHGVLADRPLILSQATWKELKSKSEALASELYSAEAELITRPDLFRDLGLPDAIEKILLKDKHPCSFRSPRFMRFDFHFTSRGWMISEVNADVPGGFIEASAFTSEMLKHYPNCTSSGDPSLSLVESVISKLPEKGRVAFVHATAYADDRQVMEFLGKYFSDRGHTTYFTGPQHVHWEHGRAKLCGPWENVPLDAVIRFFPAEWLVNLHRQSSWEGFFTSRETLQVNPPLALLVQSKRFPLVWDRLQTPLKLWRELLPPTRDARDVSSGDGHWVIKPVFSRVGEGIYMHGVTGQKDAVKILKESRRHPRHWAAQERFESVPLVMDGVECHACIGVYVIDAVACGIYGRIAERPLIDHRAKDIAVFINHEGGGI